jgi:hypothetical protein
MKLDNLLPSVRTELLRWLKQRQRESERAAKKAAAQEDYGDAQLALGHAEAYAFVILHLEPKRPF